MTLDQSSILGARPLRNVLALPLLMPLLFSSVEPAEEPTCSYTTYKWNVHARQAVDRQTVRHSYDDLMATEVHESTGCTVCEEDQIVVRLSGVDPFQVCRLIEPYVRQAIRRAPANGEMVFSVVGYRVGMTKGNIDSVGNRTQFSNHSFGIALDINAQQNGLYDRCASFGPDCRLRMGGAWIPGQVGSFSPDSPIVREFKRIGLKWGGEIDGDQKDFMHFSPSGY